VSDHSEKRASPNGPIGIAFSGGGIRSAAFTIGALSSLWRDGTLDAVQAISAVSGGSWGVGGFVHVVSTTTPHDLERTGPWAPNSPEMAHLRAVADRMIALSGSSTLAALLVLRGIALTSVLFAVSFCGIGCGLGVIFGTAGMDVGRGPTRLAINFAIGAAGGSLALLLLSMILSYSRFVPVAPRSSNRFTKVWLPTAGFWLIASGAFVIGLPGSVSALVRLGGWILSSSLSTDDGFVHSHRTGAALLTLSFASIAPISILAMAYSKIRRPVLASILSAMIAIAFACVPFLAGYSLGVARSGSIKLAVGGVAVCAAILLAADWFFDVNKVSLHSALSERLQAAFLVTRSQVRDAPASSDGIMSAIATSAATRRDRSGISPTIRMQLSRGGQVSPDHSADAHLNDPDATISQSDAQQLLVGAAEIRATGTRKRWASNLAVFEAFAGDAVGRTALGNAMALSGGAISPAVVRRPFGSFRWILSLANLRLGQWTFVAPDEGSTPQNPAGMVRYPIDELTYLEGPARRTGVVRGLVREMRLPATKSGWRHLSDGGFIDNLALLPLLEMRCARIVCFDASFRTVGGLPALARSLSEARTRLGISYEADAQLMADPRKLPESCVAHIRIRYADTDSPDQRKFADLFVVTCQLWTSAPFHLLARARSEEAFPMLPTSLQFVDDASLDDLVLLGTEAARLAVRDVGARGEMPRVKEDWDKRS
jgi:hypothetical protein